MNDGICPSYEEIKDYCGWKSKSSVNRVVLQLEKKGYVTLKYGVARSIKIKDNYEELYKRAMMFIVSKGQYEEYMDYDKI